MFSLRRAERTGKLFTPGVVRARARVVAAVSAAMVLNLCGRHARRYTAIRSARISRMFRIGSE